MREIKDIDKDIEEKSRELGKAKKSVKDLEKELIKLHNEKITIVSAQIMNKGGL